MKPIKLTNPDAVREALQAVNGLAEAHAFTTAAGLASVAAWADARLQGWGLTKVARRGAQVWATSSSPVPRTYRHGRHTTTVCLLLRPTGWFLTYAARSFCHPNQGGDRVVHLTQAQSDIAQAQFRLQYRVQ